MVMVRSHIYFKGMVQGVGFRYTARNYAVDLDLKGWVKNLPDGRVELMSEGPKAAVEELIEKLKDHYGGYIHDVQAGYSDVIGEFTDFKIAF